MKQKQRWPLLDKYLPGLLVVLMLFISQLAISQVNYTPVANSGYEWQRGRFTKTMHVPYGITPTLNNGSTSPGALFLRITGSDTTVMVWTGLTFKEVDFNSWNKTGNAGTTAGTDFIGTTDAKALDIRTNNQIAARVDAEKYFQTNKVRGILSSDADYEIDIFPDLQRMTKFHQAVGRSMFNWVRDNQVTENIKAVISVGDLCDNPTVAQFDTVSQWFDILDDASIPNVPIVGNHDYTSIPPTPSRDITLFNTYFPASRYSGKPWYIGNYDGTNANYFINFDVGEKKYTVVGLEFFPRDAVLTWASHIIDSMPDREVMLTTHGYLTVYGERSTDTSLYSANDPAYGGDNTGVELWTKLGRKHKNIRYIFGGHFIEASSDSLASHKYFSDVGLHGNTVHQFIVNYQKDSLGGNGYFMRMKVRPATGVIDISLYSSNRNINDPRYPAYKINYPNLQLEHTVGIKGDLNVNGALRADSGLYVADLEKFNIPFIGANNRFRDTNVFRYNYATGFPIMQKLIISADGKYPTLGLHTNIPATAYLVHSTTNYGLSVVRANNDASSANFSFYKTRNIDPNIRTALLVGDFIGSIGFHGVTNDASAVNNSVQIRAKVEYTAPTYISSGIEIQGYNSLGSLITKLYLSADSKLGIGTATPDSAGTFVGGLNVSGGLHFSAYPNTRNDGANPVPGAGFYTDASGNVKYGQIALITSGTYTPSGTLVTNVSGAVIASGWIYTRIGDNVQVSGEVQITPTSAAATEYGISLPIASSLVGGNELNGVATCSTLPGESAALEVDATNDRAALKFVAVTTTARLYKVIFTYRVL
ncbi:MAG TPA: hypothetical protein VF487_20270 [Chitinophagaceae bacterium]